MGESLTSGSVSFVSVHLSMLQSGNDTRDQHHTVIQIVVVVSIIVKESVLQNGICWTCKFPMTSLYQAHHGSTYATLCAPSTPHAPLAPASCRIRT
jgi:hypothetical protein